MTAHAAEPRGLRDISRNQWNTLSATTLGWGLEGFDISLFALVAAPAVADLLGAGASPASLTFHIGLAVSAFLLSWAVGAILFGVLADYIGRVRVLTIGILLYAVFTGLASLSHEFWLLLVLRCIAGLGSGIEAPVGAALMAETWNNRYRARAIGIMMSGYAAGYFLASLVYDWLSPHGWRVTLATAIVPALLVLFVRRFVKESSPLVEVQRARAAASASASINAFTLKRLFTPPLRRQTIICSLIGVGTLFAFWSITTWTPQIIRGLGAADGLTPDQITTQVAHATALLNLGGFIGYASWGFIAEWIGRRGAFLVSFAVTFASVLFLFPFAHSYDTFLLVLPFVGFGVFGAVGGQVVYFPEVFPTAVRASGISVSNSIGRFFTAGGPLVAGTIATTYFGGDLGVAVTVVAGLLVIGVVAIFFAAETRGASREVVAEDLPDHATSRVG